MRAVTLMMVATCAMTHVSAQTSRNLHVRAWSDTNGPYGTVWTLEIHPDGSARVSVASDLGAQSKERTFTVSDGTRDAILRAATEAHFLSLPEFLGPTQVPIHGPENTLEGEIGGQVRKVFLNDPANATGEEVSKFRRVWREVVAASPIKPPL